ncbi:plastocyanin/azurin family copper-binding protein [Parvibaculum sp.]|uniref:plastocyanin/azurin family copper-binding protein n=1 Tax=Parvibaculum sp. TaxID=2024848 RepID=UPI001D6789C9|nr:plastocyanin/azurin family copper-binding protein [Parvibaculum sp.]MBX3488596.1 cupredoxin domain-containing protein [Parvibaculum sp.]
MAALVGLLTGPVVASEKGHDHGSMPGMGHDMKGMMGEMDRQMADTSAFGHKGEPAQVTRTVEIESADIRFDTAELNFNVGETVRFVIVNNGEQPHEFTIGDAAYQETARKMMRHMAEMGMDPVSPEHAAMHASAGNTVTLDVGETKEIVWTFTEAGAFEFSCNLIGHSEVGMKGRIIVS